MKTSAALFLAFLLSILFVSAQEPESLRQIIPGHYAYTSGTFNSGVIATSEGVVVLDALNEELVDELRAAAKKMQGGGIYGVPLPFAKNSAPGRSRSRERSTKASSRNTARSHSDS